MRTFILTLAIASLVPAAIHAQGKNARAARVPPEITAMCATPPNSQLICEDLQEFLDAFNAESRDDGWAKVMEARIRKSRQVGGKPAGKIRALECRRARCVLEYEISVKDAARDVDGDLELDQQMDVRTGAVSLEGEDPVVGLIAWQKRVHVEDTAKLRD